MDSSALMAMMIEVTKMDSKWLVGSAAFTAAVLGGASAAAQSVDFQGAEVTNSGDGVQLNGIFYGDLDITNTAGLDELERRVARNSSTMSSHYTSLQASFNAALGALGTNINAAEQSSAQALTDLENRFNTYHTEEQTRVNQQNDRVEGLVSTLRGEFESYTGSAEQRLLQEAANSALTESGYFTALDASTAVCERAQQAYGSLLQVLNDCQEITSSEEAEARVARINTSLGAYETAAEACLDAQDAVVDAWEEARDQFLANSSGAYAVVSIGGESTLLGEPGFWLRSGVGVPIGDNTSVEVTAALGYAQHQPDSTPINRQDVNTTIHGETNTTTTRFAGVGLSGRYDVNRFSVFGGVEGTIGSTTRINDTEMDWTDPETGEVVMENIPGNRNRRNDLALGFRAEGGVGWTFHRAEESAYSLDTGVGVDTISDGPYFLVRLRGAFGDRE